ncbi:MAG: MOSC domain-containing protein, partial [Chloroflexi bacterium]|nr:MOSC domain-containing protein [Chloroflexota bacterium]
ADGLITLYSTESLAALGAAVGDTELDGRRFRSNIVISGMPTAFNELSWINKSLRIGDMEFVVIKAITRCLVTHANPATGERDRDIMNTLTTQFTGEVPQFAVKLQLISRPGVVRLGNAIEIT